MRFLRELWRDPRTSVNWAIGIYLVGTAALLVALFLTDLGPGDFLSILARPTLAVLLILAALTAPLWLVALISLLLREKADDGNNRSLSPDEPTAAPSAEISRSSTSRLPTPQIVTILTIGFTVQFLGRPGYRALTILQAIACYALTANLYILVRWREIRRQRIRALQP